MKKNIFELFLTNNNISSESWLSLYYAISKLNGIFKTWYLYSVIISSEIRFFIKIKSNLPTIINSNGDFMLKKININEIPFSNAHHKIGFPVIFYNNEKNFLDILDKMQSRKNQSLVLVKMSFFSYCNKKFYNRVSMIFQNNNKLIKRKCFLFIPHELFSINFSVYNRFFYKNDANEYLDIQKVLPYLNKDQENSFLKIDTFPYLSGTYYLSENSYDFFKHSLIVVASGTGKSQLASLLISHIKERTKYKVVIIDPHAALEKDIGGLENTKIIDFKSTSSTCDLFINTSTQDLMASIELMLSLFSSLMADLYNSKLERVLRHSIYLLMLSNKLNFSNLRKTILEVEFRNNLIHKYNNLLPDSVKNFFLTDFNELKSQSYQEAIAPIISFVDEMDLFPVFKETMNLIPLKEIIQKHFLTIFSLDQSIIGQKVTKTISGLVMQQLLELIQNHSFNEHILLVVDEVSIIENPILARFLAEARKYNLSLILIEQYFGQISENLKNAIFSNVENYYIFRVSKSDAILLESNLNMNVAIHNSYKLKLKMLTDLKNRECIVRISKNGMPYPAFKARTTDFSPCPVLHFNQILSTSISNTLNTKTFVQTNINNKNGSLNTNPEISNFTIGNLLDSPLSIMKSQSTSRKKVYNNG